MPLDDEQKLLTRLLTDRQFLLDFQKEPQSTALRAGFSCESAQRLAQIPQRQLFSSSASLIQKRLQAVAKLLPKTVKSLGETRFQSMFQQHARPFWPAGSKRQQTDANAFVDWLESQDETNSQQPFPSWIKDLARLERATVRRLQSARFVQMFILGYRPQDLHNAAASSLEDRQALCRRPSGIIGIRLSKSGRIRWLVIAVSEWFCRVRKPKSS